MTALRIINLIVWGGLVLYMIPGAWAAGSNRGARHGDPMRLSVLSVALVICGFILRTIFAPDNTMLWATLYVLCAASGCYIFVLARAYGRGPKL